MATSIIEPVSKNVSCTPVGLIIDKAISLFLFLLGVLDSAFRGKQMSSGAECPTSASYYLL